MDQDYKNFNGKTPESIKYPVTVFGDVRNASRLAIDIGGSLVKLVYLVEEVDEKLIPSQNLNHNEISPKKNFKLRFINFQTKYIEECLDFIQAYLLRSKSLFSMKTQTISATGGGSVKYRDLIKNKLGLRVQKQDEIDCIIKGCVFLLKNVKDECFSFNKNQFPYYIYKQIDPNNLFPFLLVHIGSGVSIIKVESNDLYQRIGGTSLGGGTFWGLGSLLTDAVDFDDLLRLAETGKGSGVDMLVKDIYGGDYDKLGLQGDLTASSFGKTLRCLKDHNSYDKDFFKQSDIARSLLYLVSNTIGQISCLYADKYNLKRIYFGGYFTRSNTITLHTLSVAVNYYSGGQITAHFFRHEGFMGALGAYSLGVKETTIDDTSQPQNHDEPNGYFVENIAASSYKSYSVIKEKHPLEIISLDFTTIKVSPLPALQSLPLDMVDEHFFKNYIAYIEDGIDIFIEELRNYYLLDEEEFLKLSSNFVKMLKKRLQYFKNDKPSDLEMYDGMWDMKDNFVKEYLLIDPFLKLKSSQNHEAILLLSAYFAKVDQISDMKERISFILDNLFAGNFVDMSSNEFLQYKQSGNISHENNLKFLSGTTIHHLAGTLDSFAEKFSSKKWKKVVIFADKSGFDIIFGVFGLIREFIKSETTIILISNTYPSFNTVVMSEILLISSRIHNICKIMAQNSEGRIFYGETGFGSSRLNLKTLSSNTADLCKDADLVIIEGQSRGLINNYNAVFSCDSILIGTVTTEIIAKKYGFHLFDKYIKYNITK